VRIDSTLEYDLLRSPVNTRNTTKISASGVDDETNNFSADGPVISVSFASGGVRKTRPSPIAANLSCTGPDGFFGVSVIADGSR
jgi:hypothetical protein